MLAFERGSGDDTLLCVFNLSPQVQVWQPDEPDRWQGVEQVGPVDGWSFGPFAALLARASMV